MAKELAKNILITGLPGVGKSTACSKSIDVTFINSQ